jgi:hypothetical protein
MDVTAYSSLGENWNKQVDQAKQLVVTLGSQEIYDNGAA